MRILTILICLGIFLNSQAQTSWERLSPKPSGNAGKDMFFIDNQIGIIISSSEIIKTTDAGVTWEIIDNITSGNKIDFFNSTGFIIGNKGQIYKSKDSGDTWSSLNTTFNDNLNSITIIDEDTLRITSDDNLFLTNDGGTSWESRSIPIVDVEDSYFTSADIGHVACTDGTILKTVDGGLTWYETETSNISPSDFFTIVFVTEDLGFASQEHNDIYKTTDGGESWIEINSPVDAVYSIHFLNEKIGFIAGVHGAIHKTLDGGNTWKWIGFDGRKYRNDLFSVVFLNKNEGFATGLKGRILKTTNGGASWEEYSLIYNTISYFSFTPNEKAFLQVGNEIFTSSDKGKTWINLGSPLPDQKTGQFDFINDDIGYAIVGGSVGTSGNSGSVYRTIDGGKSWSKTHQSFDLITEDLNCIEFVNDSLGFVSGGYNQKKVLKTIDAGETWTQVASVSFGKIQFVNSQIGYANRVGYYGGRMYKTTDGGETWEINFEVDESIRSFHFVNDTVGYFVGNNALIYRTTNGGKSWQELEVPYDDYGYVKFYSNYVGYILDDDGQLFRTLDGGETWESLYRLNGIKSITLNNLDIYISGEFGSILKSSIAFDELIDISPLSLINLSDSTATINTVVKSSVYKTIINIELGIRSGTYDQQFVVDTFYNYSNSIEYSFKNLEPSTEYFCRLIASDGNSIAYSQEFSFNTDSEMVTSIENETEKPYLLLYPNPASNYIRIMEVVSQLTNHYTILSINGRLIKEAKIPANRDINVSHLEKGIYLIKLKTSDGGSVIKKFVKK